MTKLNENLISYLILLEEDLQKIKINEYDFCTLQRPFAESVFSDIYKIINSGIVSNTSIHISSQRQQSKDLKERMIDKFFIVICKFRESINQVSNKSIIEEFDTFKKEIANVDEYLLLLEESRKIT